MTQQVAYTIADAAKQLGVCAAVARKMVRVGALQTVVLPEMKEPRVPHFVIENLVRERFNAQNSKGDQQ